jgi:hypothetical protein
MANTPRKTFPELSALSAPVVDSDVLAVYRSPGPAKRTTAAVAADYFGSVLSDNGTIPSVASRSALAGLTIEAVIKQIATRGYATQGDGGGANYVRTSYATIVSGGYPAASYQRSTDRIMPDGSTDAINGGYWLLSERQPSPENFGAVGDGTSNDRDAVDAWVKWGGSLTCQPGKTYKCNTPVTGSATRDTHIDLCGAVFDFSALTGTPGDVNGMTLGGSVGSFVALNADVAKGATTITSSVPVVKGDIIEIVSTDLFNPTRVAYVKGEAARVRSVSGTTIMLEHPLFDAYTAATTTIAKVTAPSVSVKNGRFIGDNNHLGLVIRYAQNVTTDGLRFSGLRYTALTLQYCYGFDVRNTLTSDTWAAATGTSYGIAIASCQHGNVTGGMLEGVRHGVTFVGWRPNRDITVSGVHAYRSPGESAVEVFEAHGNGEYLSFVNCFGSGFSINSRNTAVRGCTVIDTTTSRSLPGIRITQEIDSDFYDVEDNTVIFSSTATAIIFTPDRSLAGSPATLTTARLSVNRNKVKGLGRGIEITPNNASSTNCTVTLLEMRGNNIESGSFHAFVLTANTTTLAVTVIDSLGNTFDATAFDAFIITSTNPAGVFRSVGDTFRANRLNFYPATFSATTVDLVAPTFIGDTGGAGVSRSIRYYATGQIRVVNPTFQNLTYKAEIETGTDYAENGWNASTPTILNTAAARLVNLYGAEGRSIGYGAAAPTAGAFKFGDVTINQAPAQGAVTAWACVSAGTPGTHFPQGIIPGAIEIGDAAVTLTAGTSRPYQLWTTTLTADRAVTLSATGAFRGANFKISRPAAGAFNLNVGSGPLKALAAGQWCEVVYDGSVWRLAAFGSL